MNIRLAANLIAIVVAGLRNGRHDGVREGVGGVESDSIFCSSKSLNPSVRTYAS